MISVEYTLLKSMKDDPYHVPTHRDKDGLQMGHLGKISYRFGSTAVRSLCQSVRYLRSRSMGCLQAQPKGQRRRNTKSPIATGRQLMRQVRYWRRKLHMRRLTRQAGIRRPLTPLSAHVESWNSLSQERRRLCSVGLVWATVGTAAFDINATCLSFLMAFDRALAGFALGEWRRVLVFSADIASAALDFSNAQASVIFGDGAAAFALSSDGPHERIAHSFKTFSDAADACRLEAGGTRLRPHVDLEDFLARSKFQMDGKAVFKATASRFPLFIDALLEHAGIHAEDLSVIVPHQASAAALEHLKRALPGGHGKTVDIFADHGNQIATSMPHALHVARKTGRCAPGTLGLLIGTSAGVSLGGAVVRW